MKTAVRMLRAMGGVSHGRVVMIVLLGLMVGPMGWASQLALRSDEVTSARRRFEMALTDAFAHADDAAEARRPFVRAVVAELWALNRSLAAIAVHRRTEEGNKVLREALRSVVEREGEVDQVRARAMVAVFVAIADEAQFEPGRMMMEFVTPESRRALGTMGRILLGIAGVAILTEGTLAFFHQYLVVALTAPIFALPALEIIGLTPTEKTLSRNLIQSILLECESLLTRTALQAEPSAPPIIEQAD